MAAYSFPSEIFLRCISLSLQIYRNHQSCPIPGGINFLVDFSLGLISYSYENIGDCKLCSSSDHLYMAKFWQHRLWRRKKSHWSFFPTIHHVKIFPRFLSINITKCLLSMLRQILFYAIISSTQ